MKNEADNKGAEMKSLRLSREKKIWIIERAIARYEAAENALFGEAVGNHAPFAGNYAANLIVRALESECGENVMDRITRRQFDLLVVGTVKAYETQKEIHRLLN